MTPRELAAAIRKGHGLVGESTDFMTNRDVGRMSCCALGAAWYGLGKTEDEYWRALSTGVDLMAHTFKIPFSLADEISSKHCTGINRLAIADWLDTLEPETKP